MCVGTGCTKPGRSEYEANDAYPSWGDDNTKETQMDKTILVTNTASTQCQFNKAYTKKFAGKSECSDSTLLMSTITSQKHTEYSCSRMCRADGVYP